MDLPPGEPECGPWRPTSPAELHDLIHTGPAPPSGPRIVAIDGRGGSGKSTLAAALAGIAAARGTAADVVHTDDVAWYQAFFDWDALLAEHVLASVREGRGARYRPAAWQARGRAGDIAVSPRSALVLVEGTGAARRSLAPWLDATLWVQVDTAVARQRLRVRDGDSAAVREHIAAWDREELPFMLQEQPWGRCHWVVSSTGDGGWRLGRPIGLR